MPRRRRVPQSEFPLHITARANNRERFPLELPEMWSLICAYLYLVQQEYSLQVLALVMMPNHIHMLCFDPHGKISKAMTYFMRETSRETGRIAGKINHLWGGPYHSSIVDSPLYFLHAYKYVYRNPVEAGLCQHVEDYEFSTLHGLLGQSRLLIPVESDSLLFESAPEESLCWMNEAYKSDDRANIRAALRRPEFRIPVDRSTRRQSGLEGWDSVPFNAYAQPKVGPTL